MRWREEMVQHTTYEAVTAVATCQDSSGFGDLAWSPEDLDTLRQKLLGDPTIGVKFMTTTCVLVIEEYGGELRFYAGGRIPVAGIRPAELGVFRSIGDGLAYAEAFLLRGENPSQIALVRGTVASM